MGKIEGEMNYLATPGGRGLRGIRLRDANGGGAAHATVGSLTDGRTGRGGGRAPIPLRRVERGAAAPNAVRSDSIGAAAAGAGDSGGAAHLTR